MKSSIQGLNADLQKLREEINLGPILGSAIDATNSNNSLLRSQLSSRSRRMTYVHGIISTYGLIEEHVDNLIIEIASAYQRIYPSYDDLPECTRVSHRECSLRVLLDGTKVKLREPINESINLHILAANFNKAPLQLNPSAFTYSTTNYRHPHIAYLLRRLNVDVENCITASTVVDALTESGLEFRDTDALLHDLVARRNEIAHSYQTIELLEVGVVAAYLEVVAAYLTALFSTASNHLLCVLATHSLDSIGHVAKCWTDSVGVAMTSGHIQSPCNVLFIKEQRAFVRSVGSLQSHDTPLAGLVERISDDIELGLAINERLPRSIEGGKAYVLPDEWLHLSI